MRARAVCALLACGGAALMLGAAAGSASAPALSFAPATSHRTGDFPEAVAIADLNGDGRVDLAVANRGSGTLSVLINRGAGRFRPKHDYPIGDSASVVAGDLNGDGRPDLVVANCSCRHGVSVFLNRGGGRFLPRRDVSTGQPTTSVAIGDLDGDGKPDLATTNARAGTVSVLVGAGDGSFRLSHDYKTGRWPASIVVADLNGDGKPDVATADLGANAVSVLINRGDGSFLPRRDYRTNRDPSSISAGDLDQDGLPELVTGNGSVPDTVSVLHNRDGTFAARTNHRAGGWGNFPLTATIGDVNGDGQPDVVTANEDIYGDDGDIGIVTVLLNGGGGRLLPRRDWYGIPGSGFEVVAIGDVNGDGKPDVVAGNSGSDGISIFTNETGRCVVPMVKWLPLAKAKASLPLVGCRLGTVRRVFRSQDVERPRDGAAAAAGHPPARRCEGRPRRRRRSSPVTSRARLSSG